MKVLYTDYGDFQYTYKGSKTILYDDVDILVEEFSGILTKEEIEILIEKMF